MNTKNRLQENIIFIFLFILAILFLTPILLVLMNSFKGRFFISDTPFALPDAQTFAGVKNYISGVAKTGFIPAFGYSLFITVFSVGAIVLFTSMTAWAITRVKSQTQHNHLFPVGIFYDRSISDGHVYHVQDGQYPAAG